MPMVFTLSNSTRQQRKLSEGTNNQFISMSTQTLRQIPQKSVHVYFKHPHTYIPIHIPIKKLRYFICKISQIKTARVDMGGGKKQFMSIHLQYIDIF